MLGIFEIDNNRQENKLMILVSWEQNGREFIQVPSPRNLVMAEFDFCANDLVSPRLPASDCSRVIVSSPCHGPLLSVHTQGQFN